MHQPYRDASTNQAYHALFCDDWRSAVRAAGDTAAPWQRALMAGPAFTGALRRLIEDPSGDARVRALACHRLREHGHVVQPRRVFGVVVEAERHGSLETLAAYIDGQVSLLQNHRCDTETRAAAELQDLLDAARAAVDAHVLTAQARSMQAASGVRITYITSDGLFVDQGSAEALQRDALSAPVLRAARALRERLGEVALAAAA